jgi:hypothetical protein
MLTVERGGRSVRGAVSIVVGDSAWTFTPASPWQTGSYGIRVDADLEDLAGNSVARVFDAERRPGAPAFQDTTPATSRSIGFRVR